MTVVLHHSRAKGTAKLVLLGIANHQGDGGAWPSVTTLARYANVHERNVQRAIDQLIAKGELARQVQDGGGRDLPDNMRPNRYDVLVSCPGWCDRSTQHRDTRGSQSTLRLGVSLPTPPPRLGVSHATPLPPSLATPEPSLEPHPHQVVPQVQDTRACQDCGKDERRCQSSQARWPQDDRHPYRPSSRPRP